MTPTNPAAEVGRTLSAEQRMERRVSGLIGSATGYCWPPAEEKALSLAIIAALLDLLHISQAQAAALMSGAGSRRYIACEHCGGTGEASDAIASSSAHQKEPRT